MTITRPQQALLRAAGLALAIVFASAPVSAQLTLKNENAQFNFGIEGQIWGDWAQSSTGGVSSYQQNLYVRRIRLMVGGSIGDNISFFFETDDPKLGLTPKALGSGFMVQDAFFEWKAAKAFQLDGGLMLVPFSRNTLQSTLSYYSLDLSPITVVNNASTQSSGLRDVGFGARGFFHKDKLQYRMGLFQGERDSNARNSLRSAGFLQYDFFESETAYTLVGTALGKKKILAVNGGFDRQGSYRSLSGDVAADIPVRGGDEIGGQFQYIHYDGRDKFLAIPNQNDFLVEGAYYVHRIRTQPFVKAESQRFVAPGNYAKDVNRYGAGLNYYIHGQNLKCTFQYLRAIPENSPLKPSNDLAVQLQFFYF